MMLPASAKVQKTTISDDRQQVPGLVQPVLLSWAPSLTMELGFCVEALKRAFGWVRGAPQHRAGPVGRSQLALTGGTRQGLGVYLVSVTNGNG
jgi:hypothetical protein